MKKNTHAFSLLEMLIVLAIISILCGISYPPYSHYRLTQQRFSAKTALLTLATALENYFTSHNSYQGATFTTLSFPAETIDHQYTLQIHIVDDNHYLLSAAPLHPQDTVCGTLSFASTGEKSISGTGPIHDCW